MGQIVREFEWVQEAVQERIQSLDEPDGGAEESASFSAGDQPPLAASRGGGLAAAPLFIPGPSRSSGAVRSPALPGPAGVVLVVCRGVSAGREVAPSGAFAALSPLARLARNPAALGVGHARTMRAADCFVVRVSHEIAVPVGLDRPLVADRNDVRPAAIRAAPLRVPLLKDPADNHIRLVQLAGARAGSPSVGSSANIHLPIVVHSGDGVAAVRRIGKKDSKPAILTRNRQQPGSRILSPAGSR